MTEPTKKKKDEESGYWLQSEQRYLTKIEVALAGSRRGSDRIAGINRPLSSYLYQDPRDLPRVPIEDR